jgi:hypothetical protein
VHVARSLTIDLPSARNLAIGVVVIVAAVLVIVLGLQVAADVVFGGPLAQLARKSTLQELQLSGGITYVGRVESDADGWIRLADPAVIREQTGQGASASSATGYIVQALIADPFDMQGDVVVAERQVTSVGNVADGSSLAQAYERALHGGAQPTPSATGSPTP